MKAGQGVKTCRMLDNRIHKIIFISLTASRRIFIFSCGDEQNYLSKIYFSVNDSIYLNHDSEKKCYLFKYRIIKKFKMDRQINFIINCNTYMN